MKGPPPDLSWGLEIKEDYWTWYFSWVSRGNRASAKKKGGEKDLGQRVLLSRGTCICRSEQQGEALHVQGTAKIWWVIGSQSEQELLRGLAKQLGLSWSHWGPVRLWGGGECDCVRFSFSGFLGWCRGSTRMEQLGLEAESNEEAGCILCWNAWLGNMKVKSSPQLAYEQLWQGSGSIQRKVSSL